MFILSKIAWLLLKPTNLWFLLLCAGVIALWFRRGLGVWLVSVAVVFAVAVTVVPVGLWLLTMLENRFPRPELPAKVDGIVVLGGAVDPALSKNREQIIVNGTVERLLALVELARRYPKARLVFTGGSGSLFDQSLKEADVAKRLLRRIGADVERIRFERESRNTWENAVNAKRLAAPKPGETWLLITSARHMPRAVGAFRKAGWTVVPYPVDYRTERDMSFRPSFHLLGGLAALDAAAKEWIGLVGYYLLGRSPSLFPAP